MKLNEQVFARQEATRLLIGNIPYAIERDEFFRTLAQHGKIHGGFLSRATSPDRNNAGWAIVTVDATTAHTILTQTVLIGGQVVRIKRARPHAAGEDTPFR